MSKKKECELSRREFIQKGAAVGAAAAMGALWKGEEASAQPGIPGKANVAIAKMATHSDKRKIRGWVERVMAANDRLAMKQALAGVIDDGSNPLTLTDPNTITDEDADQLLIARKGLKDGGVVPMY